MDETGQHQHGVATLRVGDEDLFPLDHPFAGRRVPGRGRSGRSGIGASDRLGEADGDRLIAPACVLFLRASDPQCGVSEGVTGLAQGDSATPVLEIDQRMQDLGAARLGREGCEHGPCVRPPLGFRKGGGQHPVLVMLEIARIFCGKIGLSPRLGENGGVGVSESETDHRPLL